ncbi:MAG TPA: DUF4446 family protein [Patescibacteria group bacterium]|nr:DUF4446 family protein [Patescibacteria group bacterium]
MFHFFEKEKQEPKELKEVLKQFKSLKKNFSELSSEFENLKKEHRFSIQKIGIIRFNPFSEVGGDQSFSVALLDAKDDGLVITSFYTREGNRVYGKPIKSGKSQYALSQEEIKAIEAAKYYERPKNNPPAGEADNQAADCGGSGTY